MSIYATLWTLKFPKHGESFKDSEWIEVTAQGVPPHIGSPTSSFREKNDPFTSFPPPPIRSIQMVGRPQTLPMNTPHSYSDCNSIFSSTRGVSPLLMIMRAHAFQRNSAS